MVYYSNNSMTKRKLNIKELLKAIEEMYAESDEKKEMEKTLTRLLNQSPKKERQ